MVKYYKTSGGYFYKKLNNGDIKRISSKVYNNNVIKGGAGGGGGDGGGGGASGNNLRNRKIDFYIASFGFKNLIKEILTREGYDKYFKDDHIITNAGFVRNNTNNTNNINNTTTIIPQNKIVNHNKKYYPIKEGIDLPNKNHQLELIRKNKLPTTVLLVDDTHSNILAADKLGYRTYHVPNDYANGIYGIQGNDMFFIVAIIDMHPEIDTVVFDADLTFFNIHATTEYGYPYQKEHKITKNKNGNPIDPIYPPITSNNAKTIIKEITPDIRLVAEGVKVLFDELPINRNNK